MKKLITLIIFLFAILGYSQTNEIDSLTIQLAYQNADTSKVVTSVKLIKLLYDTNDYDRALKFIAQSEKLSNNLKYNKGVAEVTYYKALIYAKKNDYINAINNYTKSKSLFAQLKDTLGIARVNNSIGLIEIKRGNYNKGLQYSLSAIKELEKRNLIQDLSLAYGNLAKLYYNIKAYDKALDFNLKTLQLQQQLNNTQGLITSNFNLPKICSSKVSICGVQSFHESIIIKQSFFVIYIFCDITSFH